MNIVQKTVKEKCGLDIEKLQPQIYASKTKTPAFFLHAVADELISLEQTLKLVESYGVESFINVFDWFSSKLNCSNFFISSILINSLKPSY